jgi:hypothetical protein
MSDCRERQRILPALHFSENAAEPEAIGQPKIQNKEVDVVP